MRGGATRSPRRRFADRGYSTGRVDEVVVRGYADLVRIREHPYYFDRAACQRGAERARERAAWFPPLVLDEDEDDAELDEDADADADAAP